MIILSWPPKELNPNSRCHWAKKAKATKAYRNAAGWATVESKDKVEGDGSIWLNITFYPPDKRRRDLDGMLSSIKGGLDGIADGLAVNDCRFKLQIEVCSVIKGGQVRVIITG